MPPASSDRADRPGLVLHIGSGKTGTSSIQHLLQRNRARLAEHGVLVPRAPGARRHVQLGLAIRSTESLQSQITWRPEKYGTPAEFRADFERRLVEEIEGSGCPRVLLTDEALYGSTQEALERLRRLTDRIAGSVRVVVYLRRQDDHVCSRYQEVLKTGEVRTFARRLDEIDLTTTYDYATRLRRWQQVLEPAELVVRPFERERFVDGSLYQDFLDAVGIDVRADDLEQVGSRNLSLDAEAAEFLRILNVYRVEHEGARVGLIRNRPLVNRLAEHATGPTLTLPEARLDAFMSQWEESNAAVARDHLGDPSGVLFHAPRRTEHTTAEQYLDPSRLDHFLDLAELPETIHGPLRRLVEREASAERHAAR